MTGQPRCRHRRGTASTAGAARGPRPPLPRPSSPWPLSATEPTSGEYDKSEESARCTGEKRHARGTDRQRNGCDGDEPFGGAANWWQRCGKLRAWNGPWAGRLLWIGPQLFHASTRWMAVTRYKYKTRNDDAPTRAHFILPPLIDHLPNHRSPGESRRRRRRRRHERDGAKARRKKRRHPALPPTSWVHRRALLPLRGEGGGRGRRYSQSQSRRWSRSRRKRQQR